MIMSIFSLSVPCAILLVAAVECPQVMFTRVFTYNSVALGYEFKREVVFSETYGVPSLEVMF